MLFPSLPSQPMDYFESLYRRRGYHQIAGVDEVGRGPLAGPVLAAAVILPRDGIGAELFDSKQISSKKREDLYPVILSEASGRGNWNRRTGGDRSHQYPSGHVKGHDPGDSRIFPSLPIFS